MANARSGTEASGRVNSNSDKPVCLCHACGGFFETQDQLREHQLYCSDPSFCLCHVDRNFSNSCSRVGSRESRDALVTPTPAPTSILASAGFSRASFF